MKKNHGRSRFNFILAFLLIAAMTINEGIWPFAEAGGLNSKSIRADDFSGNEAVYIDDSNLFEDASGSVSQEQTGDIIIGDQVSSQDNASTIQGSAQRTDNQKELIASEGQNGISMLYTEAAGIPEDAVLKLRDLKEKEIKAYLDRAEKALNWKDPELSYVRIYDLTIQKDRDVNFSYVPVSSVMVEIRILDSAVMNPEQKQQFIRQNADLLDPDRTYTDLEQQFTELRQKYLRQMHLENLQIVSLGQKDELLQTTTEDGVIRFKADKLYPYVLLMRSDDMQESSWDFNAGEDPAAIWSFEDTETEDILKEAEEASAETESEVADIESEDNQDEAAETGDSMEEPVNAETDREDMNEVEAEDAGLSDFEQTEENAWISETEQQLVSSGEDYEISVVYNSDAKIPEGSELVVNEISENTGRFDTLSEQAIAALDTDEDSILAVKLVDVSIDKDGEMIEPEAEVGITVLLTAQEDNQAIDTQVIAISGTTEVLAASENSDSVTAAEAVTYETASQTMDTVYAIVTRSITKELTASDGNDYLVTVTYDSAAGIPSDAELIVSEIKEGDGGYEEYVAKSADALGERLDDLQFARAFDITLKNPETGEEYQPTKDVRVSIRLQNENLSNYENVDVVHIPDDDGGQAEVMDSNLNGEVVEFTTDGFSVYVLTAGNGKTVTPQYTFTFFIPNEDVSGDYKEYSFTDSQGRTIYHQIITDRSELVVPQMISTENADFVGWYEG
ncbi:MAG: hypothetical protein IJW67_08945, partial [Blautia sp.]|nr:hypothetical protein [Blautia sp.]